MVLARLDTSELNVTGFSKIGRQSKKRIPFLGKSSYLVMSLRLGPGYCPKEALKVATCWSKSASFFVAIFCCRAFLVC